MNCGAQQNGIGAGPATEGGQKESGQAAIPSTPRSPTVASQVLIRPIEPIDHFHGSSSRSLFGTLCGGLKSLAQQKAEGRVPFSGENAEIGYREGNDLNEFISFSDTHGMHVVLSNYCLVPTSFLPWTPEVAQRAIEKIQAKKTDPNYSAQDIQRIIDGRLELLHGRIECWEHASPLERKLIEDPFPTLYGIHLSTDSKLNSNSTPIQNQLSIREVGIRGNVPAEKLTIIVPDARINQVLEAARSVNSPCKVAPLSLLQSEFRIEADSLEKPPNYTLRYSMERFCKDERRIFFLRAIDGHLTVANAASVGDLRDVLQRSNEAEVDPFKRAFTRLVHWARDRGALSDEAKAAIVTQLRDASGYVFSHMHMELWDHLGPAAFPILQEAFWGATVARKGKLAGCYGVIAEDNKKRIRAWAADGVRRVCQSLSQSGH